MYQTIAINHIGFTTDAIAQINYLLHCTLFLLRKSRKSYRPTMLTKRQFTMSLKTLKPRAADYVGPKILGAVAILAFKKWGGQTEANQNCGEEILKPLTIRQFVAFMVLLWFCTKFNNVFFTLYRDETKTCLNMPMIVSKHCLAKRIMVPYTVT